MAKLILSNIASFLANSTAVATSTANNDAIELALENTLSLDGTTPNSMTASLDMNSNRILNHPEPDTITDLATKNYVDNNLILESTPQASVSTFMRTALDDADAATLRATAGSTTTGDALFIAASAAAARATLGSTTTGDALFIAASASAGRTALGFGAAGGIVVTGDIADAAVTAVKIDGTTLKNKNLVFVTVEIPDISTAQSVWVAPGIAGNIVGMTSVIETAITVADAILTAEIGGVLVTGSSITVAFTGAAAGDVDTAAPSALNTITATDAIELITDGGSTTASVCRVTFEIDVT